MAREGQLVSFKLAFLNFARETHIKGKCGPRTIIVNPPVFYIINSSFSFVPLLSVDFFRYL